MTWVLVGVFLVIACVIVRVFLLLAKRDRERGAHVHEDET